MRFIILFLSLICIYNVNAKKLSEEQLTVSYVYQLSKNIEWNNNRNNFTIHLVSSNENLNNEFKLLSKNVKLNGKKIIITISQNTQKLKKSDVIFITKEKQKYYKQIFNATRNNKTLIISKDYNNKKLVMINLFTTDQNTINFEINRANIISKDFGIKPDMIFLGGTELDVANLYRDARDSLSSKEKEIQKVYNDLSSLKKNVAIQNKKLFLMKEKITTFKKENTALQAKINTKEIILKKTKKEIKKNSNNVEELKNKIIDKNEKITNQEVRLKTLSQEFKAQDSLLKKQMFIVLKKENELENLEKNINIKTEEFKLLKIKISNQNILLENQVETIDKQKSFLWMTLVFLSIFSLLALLIFYFLRKQRNINTLLTSAQDELRIAKNKADDASINKSKFIASMSHELRTPLNAVLGYSQLLQKDKTLSSKHKGTLATIRKSGEHLLGLINDILLISKMESGNIEMHYRTTNIYELVESMYSMFLLKTEQKNIELEYVINEDVPQYIETDIDKLRQIFINLLNNAVKFTQQGKIKIYLESSLNQDLILSIIDTGVGIHENEIKKLFKQYEQTQSGINEGNGTGLGLSLVEEFVKLFKGQVIVSSTEGKGSIFKVIIPYKTSDITLQKEKLKDIIGITPNLKKHKVLIVDDNLENINLLYDILNSIGFLVTKATNGLKAIESVNFSRPDIILMDLRMPVMNGKEATDVILAIDKTIPIIAITASIVEMETLINNPAPFVAAIPKPFDSNKLLFLMGDHLNVNYIYEEEVEEIRLQSIPREDRKKLLTACKTMNITVINSLINTLDNSYSIEKKYMESLLSDLNFEKLENLLT